MYKRRQGIHPVVLILILAVICVAATIIILLSMGYRYVAAENSYTNTTDKFFGKVVGKQPVSGTIRYPGGMTATLDYYNETIEYSNGDIYKGDILRLYRHGIGVMTYYATGDKYEGDFKYDQIDGKGKYTYRNGDVYNGDFENNKMNGRGIYNWVDGSKYEGEFKNGLPDGYGVFTFAASPGTAAARYEGEFKNGVKNGNGTYYFDNGDTYIGTFVNDKRVGEGVYKYANGDVYMGNFIDNKLDTRVRDSNGEFKVNPDGTYIHGETAVYTWVSGRSYTGYFENGKIVVIGGGD